MMEHIIINNKTYKIGKIIGREYISIYKYLRKMKFYPIGLNNTFTFLIEPYDKNRTLKLKYNRHKLSKTDDYYYIVASLNTKKSAYEYYLCDQLDGLCNHFDKVLNIEDEIDIN